MKDGQLVQFEFTKPKNGDLMTTKEKMLNVISSLEDDSSIDQAIYRLNLLRKIEIGQRQIEAGQFMEHEEFMDQLENENIQ